MSIDAKLLPCPFCGGKAEIIEIDEGENAGGSCVCCIRCMASGTIEFGRKENFVSNWNTRTPHPALVTAREADPVAWAAYDDSLPVDVDLRQDIADQWCADGIEVRPLYAHPPQPSETVAEALREIRAAVQDGNLSQGVRLDIIDKIALRALSSTGEKG
ncbi:Lar family restriction alleviation protein [uncultured Paracoccus sp.]|uniref:Lar family restriction alleviation protein n=1 Tax=uncultured Paracoccus sp. TaxID=189685 RepID=UPI0025967761|nr:Lar family restriction alleviation protein [uncultured Paracoccus sp.]